MSQIKVRKGNEVLHVDSSLEDYYVNKGFNVVEEDGTVKRAAIPSNIGELQFAYVEHKKKIATLEAQIADLTTQLTAKKTKTKKVAENEE